MQFDIERYLKIRGATSPTFSPDGGKIAYVTETTGVPQAWSVALKNPWPEQLTFFGERVAQVKYSPVVPELVFSMDAGGNERMQIYLLKDDGSCYQNLTSSPESIHSFGGWSPDGTRIAFSSNRRDPRYFDIYVMDVRTRETKMVFKQNGTNHVACWTYDGNGLVIRRSNTNLDQDLFHLDLNTGECKHLTPHAQETSFRSIASIPGRKKFYLVTNWRREFSGIATLDLDGKIEYIVTPQWDVEDIVLSTDGKYLAYTVNKTGYSELHVMDTGTGREIEVPPMPKGVIVALTWDNSGRKLAFTFTGSCYNPDVWMLDIDSTSLSQVTHSSRAGIPQETFVEPNLVTYTTFDGRSIPAFFYKPAPKARLPVVVQVHGGPEGQARPSFNAVIQYFVNRGYAVFAPNVRGSSGYGREYIHLDDVRKRMDSVRDLALGVEWLKTQPDVDPKKIAVMGGSYGGFMVLASVTTYPDLWAAGVDIVGIANFETFLLNTGPWRRHLREAEYGSLEKDLEFFRQISPIYHVDKIKCPLMVIHGKNDPRVPFGEAVQIVEKLKARGAIVEPLFFEDEGHGVVKLANKLVAYRKIADFLDKYVAQMTR